MRPPLVDKFVLGTDIESYSGRTAREHGEVQRSLDWILTEAAETVGLDRTCWYRQPGGDGELCALPAGTDLVTVVRGFVAELDTLLTDHNQDHAKALRLRLRVAMHIDVMSDAPLGPAGPAFITLSRLLNSDPLHNALSAVPTANLALMLSEPVYRKAVLSEMGGLRPAQFRPVEVDIPSKGFHETAYIRRLPGECPTGEASRSDGAPRREETGRSQDAGHTHDAQRPEKISQPRVSGDYLQIGGSAVVGSSIGGDVVFGNQHVGDQYYGDLYFGGGVQPLVPVRTSEDVKTGWQGGADVTVGAHTFLLDESHLSERFSADYSTAFREARAIRSGGHKTQYVWLRQVEALELTAQAERALATLSEEHLLLDRLGNASGIPRAYAFEERPDGRRTTLALTWPASRLRPQPTMSQDLSSRYEIYHFFQRLGRLCHFLDSLHAKGVSHRALSPEAIIALDGYGVALRDLGLAAHDPRVGEGPVTYPAPEQQSRRRTRPGPATDSHQVAALACHLLTGRIPTPGLPLSTHDLRGLPDTVVQGVNAALADDASARPPVRELASVFMSTWRMW